MSRFRTKMVLEKVAAPQDSSIARLQELLAAGSTDAVWNKNYAACPNCVGLHGMTWPLQTFIMGLMHNAPIFEKSHVGCRCSVIVQNPTTGEEEEVFAY